MEKRNWISIFLWGFGIALVIFFLMWLRIGYLDPYLNDTTDSVLFFVPHILITFWGITVGLSFRSNQQNRATLIKWPFFTLLFAMIIFDIMFSFWGVYADHNLDINPNRSYLLSAITASVLFSWVAALIIITPFFIGYIPAKIVRYISDCTKMKDPKQHLLR